MGQCENPVPVLAAKNGNPSLSEEPDPHPPGRYAGVPRHFCLAKNGNRIPAAPFGSSRGDPPHTIAKAGMFCVCESRLSHRLPIFLTPGDVRSTQFHVARHAACLNAPHRRPPALQLPFWSDSRDEATYAESIVFQSFDYQSVCRPVSRHGIGPNVRLK